MLDLTRTGRHIIVRGVEVPLVGDPAPECITWRESGLEFNPLNTRCTPRFTPPTLITVHNKGGEGDGRRTYQVLLKKGLSVEFSIDRDGLIWQYCDPGRVSCAHMGKGNTRSVGIEVTNTVIPFDNPATKDNERKLFFRGLLPRLIYGREQHVELYRQHKRRVLSHFPEQKASVRSLVLTLLGASCFPSVPPRLPRDPVKGYVTGDRLPDDWEGVAGHLHFQESGYVNAKAHVDPAQDVFDDLLTVLG